MNTRLRKISSPKPSRLSAFLQYGDRPWTVLLVLGSFLVLALMLGIGVMLWRESADARTTLGWNFFVPSADPHWDPVNDIYQAWPFVYGTAITALVAVLLAVPISLGIAIFLAEVAPAWLRTPLSGLVELLAAIPSVVYGVWGIFVFLPVVVAPLGGFLGGTLGQVPVIGVLFNGAIPPSGSSRLAAGMILAIMIIPTISAVTRDVLLTIPNTQREASLALGSTQWESINKVVLPNATSGVLGAVILGLGRALGETMAVTMVIGNSIQGGLSLLQPGYSMASVLANEFAESLSSLHTQAMFELGLVLFGMTLLLNLLARMLVWRVSRNSQAAH